MIILIFGLLLFIGAHIAISRRTFRAQTIARMGEAKWKLAVSTVSLLGLVLIVYGFGSYREQGYVTVYDPPLFLRHIALVLNLPVFILVSAAYLPGRIKSAVKHPMLLATKLWAAAHLFANGDLGSVILFGSILTYAIYTRINVKKREVFEPRVETSGPLRNDLVAILIGLVTYLLVIKWLHFALIGVPPL